MGNKRKRVIMEAGSLLSPMFRYVLDMRLMSNPTDLHGTKLLRHLHRQVQFIDWRLHQPSNRSLRKTSMSSTPSKSVAGPASSASHLVRLSFMLLVNGWEKVWYLKYADMTCIYDQI